MLCDALFHNGSHSGSKVTLLHLTIDDYFNWPEQGKASLLCAEALQKVDCFLHSMGPRRNNKRINFCFWFIDFAVQPLTPKRPEINLGFQLFEACFALLHCFGLALCFKMQNLTI